MAEFILDGKFSSVDVSILDLFRFDEGRSIPEYNVVKEVIYPSNAGKEEFRPSTVKNSGRDLLFFENKSLLYKIRSPCTNDC